MATYQGSGAYFYIAEGRWLTQATILLDGSLVDRHGIPLEHVPLSTEVFTVREITSAVANAGKRTRLDLVNRDGLTLTNSVGKGRNTIQRIIELRNPKRAAEIVAAYIAQMETVEEIAA